VRDTRFPGGADPDLRVPLRYNGRAAALRSEIAIAKPRVVPRVSGSSRGSSWEHRRSWRRRTVMGFPLHHRFAAPGPAARCVGTECGASLVARRGRQRRRSPRTGHSAYYVRATSPGNRATRSATMRSAILYMGITRGACGHGCGNRRPPAAEGQPGTTPQRRGSSWKN
jgi:hypothetical protein